MATAGAYQQQALPPQGEQEPDSSELYATDNFRINFMKVLPCSKRYCHDWTVCPFAHPGEKARRRDPRVTSYTGIACPDMKKDGVCVRGELCPYAHNVFEYWLHPTRYRTQLCNDGTNCKRRVCFFAHTLPELRVPDSKPFVNPQALAAAGAAAGARRSGQAMESLASNAARMRSGISDANGAAELANRLAILQLPRSSGASSQAQMAAALLAGQPLQQAQQAQPSSDSQNAQLMQLLSALLAQKQRQQQEQEQNNQYAKQQGIPTNEQLAALYQAMGVVSASEQPSVSHETMNVDATGQLAQLQALLQAQGGKRTSPDGQADPTPRSSLDMSGLQGYAPSDYTPSSRSSFETYQGRGSMENRRYSYDGTLRPDVASMFSGSRSSFDSAVIGRPSYESAYAPRVSLDSAAPRLSSEATVSFLQMSNGGVQGAHAQAAFSSPFEQARAPGPISYNNFGGIPTSEGEFQRKSAPLQSDIAPDANHWRSNSDNFAGAAGLQSLGGHIWNPSEAFAMSRTGNMQSQSLDSRCASMPVSISAQQGLHLPGNRGGSGSGLPLVSEGSPYDSVRSGSELFTAMMAPHNLPAAFPEASLPPLPPNANRRLSLDSQSQAPHEVMPHLMGALPGSFSLRNDVPAPVTRTGSDSPSSMDSLFAHSTHSLLPVSQAAQLEARTYSGTSSLGALYEPSSSYNPTPSSRPLSSNAEDEN
eukprot:CAMPEP_0206137268 /NCGR_PEP_ID=MMETSP1473-20131121/2422_1 /ASSEMBLY_ACC=CAM_ASM_001109 /TAXON_ID=1461547 /ORGANISM="Stichococcus sp, Strain RCC1054" /LENGTH=704 /DNA_ID=CAMNT_0053530267 /DNA_START=127 /DNA_END=2241 /DNA_ORIENTATION=-